jgi:hypothetical protein
VQCDLCLVQFLLNLENAVRLIGVLVLCNVVLELWHCQLCAILREALVGGLRIFRDELVEDFGEERMCDELGIFEVGDYYATYACGMGVDVEYVVWND